MNMETTRICPVCKKALARIFHRPPCTKLGTLISTAIYRGMGDSGSAVGFRQCV